MLFVRNKIKEDEELVGEKLRHAREEKNLSLEQVSQKLSIKEEYLSALENSDYHGLPGGVYEKTFLKKYASLIGLNPAAIFARYKAEKNTKEGEKIDVFSKKRIKGHELVVFTKIVRNTIFIILVAALFSYLVFFLKISFTTPKIEIFSPTDNLVTTENFIEVIGKTDPKTEVSINEQQILKDPFGNFHKKIELKDGLNTIVISGQNKYSQKKIIQKQILVK